MLKSVLEHIQDPQALGAHPWTKSPVVEEAVSRQPEVQRLPPRMRLLSAHLLR